MSTRLPHRYVPTGEVLTGGMGEVLLCNDIALERKVAIKFIRNVDEKRRLFDEISALQKIRSKHVVQIFDVFVEEDNRIGIVQEYVPGSDLSSFSEVNTLSAEEYLKTLYQIASGISDIHAQGLIHRDIKPNNIKFDQVKIIKIFDFGLARFSGKDDSTIGFRGTPGFAAPELYRGGVVPFNESIDTYAFGATAWYLSGAVLPESLMKKPPQTTNIPGFSSLPIDVPSPVTCILDSTLRREPSSRPSMSDIRDILSSYLLKDRHRALIVYGANRYTLEKTNRLVRLDVQSYGSLQVRYDGINFSIPSVTGEVFVNNQSVQQGQVLPKDCVITVGNPSRGGERVFITFDISNPEVVL